MLPAVFFALDNDHLLAMVAVFSLMLSFADVELVICLMTLPIPVSYSCSDMALVRLSNVSIINIVIPMILEAKLISTTVASSVILRLQASLIDSSLFEGMVRPVVATIIVSASGDVGNIVIHSGTT